MKRRFKQEDDDAGLDSLLDTMTNVVGILVLVLIVTQMGVKEKMADITANSTVTVEEVQTAQADLKKQQRELETLRKQSKSVSSFDIQAERQRLERMKKQLASGQRDVEQQTKQINEFTLRIEGDRKRAAELEKKSKTPKPNARNLMRRSRHLSWNVQSSLHCSKTCPAIQHLKSVRSESPIPTRTERSPGSHVRLRGRQTVSTKTRTPPKLR